MSENSASACDPKPDHEKEDEESHVVTMVDVLEEQNELEADANAVLGGSDPQNCTYPEGYVKRQALYACLTCTPSSKSRPGGVCLACSYSCHEGHELVELYTKRNFRCDCGSSAFGKNKCNLVPDKEPNQKNKYNQNFLGLYCICHRPYPDPEDSVEDDMIQCIICEDWYHGRHLGLETAVPSDFGEMICQTCMKDHSFLWRYAYLCIPSVPAVPSVVKSVTEGTDGAPKISQEAASGVGNGAPEGTPKHSQESASGVGNGAPEGTPKHSQESASGVGNGAPEGTPKHSQESASGVGNGAHEGTPKNSQQSVSDVEKGTPEIPATSGIPNTGCYTVATTTSHDLGHKGCGVLISIEPWKGATFWPNGWRLALCTCDHCKKRYAREGIEFLTNVQDTVLFYEQQGKEKTANGNEGSQYDRAMQALSSLDRVKQVEAIHGFNDMKNELKEYLQKFAQNGKIVREEDIREFFTQMARKRQRVDIPTFCR